MRRMPATCVVAVVALSAVLGACGSGSVKTSSSTTAAPSSSSSSPSTASSSSTTAGPCVPGATAGPFSATASSGVLMTDLTVQAAGCADKVTFSFKPGTGAPGYDVRYKPGPFSDAGSGNAHPVAGATFVVVRFNPAWIADFGQPSAPLTYRGPKSIHPTGVAHVQDLELIEAFEGYVAWVVGLDSNRPLTVTTTASPPSLVLTVG